MNNIGVLRHQFAGDDAIVQVDANELIAKNKADTGEPLGIGLVRDDGIIKPCPRIGIV